MKVCSFIVVFILLQHFGCISDGKFYKKILGRGNTNELVVLEKIQNKFSLRADSDLEPGQVFAQISKNIVLSGCNFFPFKDVFHKLLRHYCKSRRLHAEDTIIPVFALVYHLLYFRFANKEKTKTYFRTKFNINSNSDFYFFELKPEEKEFMQILHKLKLNSVFNYTEDELNLARRLNIPLIKYDLAMDLFNFMQSNLLSSVDSELNDIFQDFITQEEAFKLYSDITFRFGLFVKTKDYGAIYPQRIREEDYTSYHNNIKQANDMCVILLPLTNLLEHQTRKNEMDESTSSSININVTIRPESGVDLSIDQRYKKGSTLGFTFNSNDFFKMNENLFVEYGVYSKDTKETSVRYLFKKNVFTKKKATICYLFGCGGFDVNLFHSDSITETEHMFIVNNSEINKGLLNVLKLVHMDENKLKVEVHPFLFIKNHQFSKDIESKAIQDYISITKQNGVDYMTLLNDVKLSKETNEINETSKTLLQLALDKQYILANQQKFAIEEYKNVIVSSIKKLKENINFD